MNYKFTFQDGSEALMHYGVKGMKWGVWNEETASRYRGESSKAKKKYSKAVESQGRLDRYRTLFPASHKVLQRIGSRKREKALNNYADALIRDLSSDSRSSKDRESLRNKEEAEADKLLTQRSNKETPKDYWNRMDGYYSKIRQLEFDRAVEKAAPRGREAVKNVIEPWRNPKSKGDRKFFVSEKVAAASEGIPVKTKQEGSRYMKIRQQFNEEYYKSQEGKANKLASAEKAYEDFKREQLKKYAK